MGMEGTFHVIKAGVIYELRGEPEGGFTINVPVLPGCMSYGETFEEAMTMIADAMDLWIDFSREKGFDIPAMFDLKRVS